MSRITCLCLFLMTVSCAPRVPRGDTITPQILSAILQLSTVEGEPSLRLTDFFLGEGRLKAATVPDGPLRPGDLRCTFLDRRRRQLHVLSISDPLSRHFEYAESDGAFRRAHLRQDAADVALRVQWQPAMRFLRVERMEENKKMRVLAILPVETDRLGK